MRRERDLSGSEDPRDERVTEGARSAAGAESRTLDQDEVLGAIGQAVLVADPRGRVTFWNAAAESRYGWSREEAEGRGIVELLAPPEEEEELRAALEGITGGVGWTGELDVSRRDGSTFPARVTLSPVLDGAGALAGIVGVTMDVSEARAAEARKRELIRALEHERSRLESVFRQAPAFMAVLRGPSHVFELANAAYRAMVGDRELLGRPLAEALPEAEEQGVTEVLDEVWKTERSWRGDEVRIVLRPGTGEERELFCNLVYQPITDVDGQVRRIIVHGVDVTDLVRARHRAEEANRAKSDFLAAVSHELRTPLNAIRGYIDLMELGVPTEAPESVGRYLERVRLSANHLLHLIEDVLTLSRAGADRISARPEPVSPEDLADEVRAIMEPVVRRKGLDLSVEVDGLPERIVTDPRMLRQIMVNLAGNAAKFTEEGSVRVCLCSSDNAHFVIRVEDTGPGIEADQIDRLFEPFWQGDPADGGGAGLGLTLAQRLTGLLDGEITVESEPEVGSVFIVEIPLETPAEVGH